MLCDLTNKGFLLIRSSFRNALLHYAASMLMASDLFTMVDHFSVDEIIVWCFEHKKCFLNDMISIDVLD